MAAAAQQQQQQQQQQQPIIELKDAIKVRWGQQAWRSVKGVALPLL
jgi:hypothetical protein